MVVAAILLGQGGSANASWLQASTMVPVYAALRPAPEKLCQLMSSTSRDGYVVQCHDREPLPRERCFVEVLTDNGQSHMLQQIIGCHATRRTPCRQQVPGSS